MAKSTSLWIRRFHRWGSFAILLPLLLVIVTGLLLQLKKYVAWVQPPTNSGTAADTFVGFDRVLEAAKSAPEANIASWDDIDRLDVRPGKSMVKVQAKNHWEVQVDLGTGQVLSTAYRRSDWLETLHDGSFFSEYSRLYLFFPAGVVLLGLWVSGLYLWALPFWAKYQKRQKRARPAG
jgi:uncharacterized iron-regulated membrane protein